MDKLKKHKSKKWTKGVAIWNKAAKGAFGGDRPKSIPKG